MIFFSFQRNSMELVLFPWKWLILNCVVGFLSALYIDYISPVNSICKLFETNNDSCIPCLILSGNNIKIVSSIAGQNSFQPQTHQLNCHNQTSSKPKLMSNCIRVLPSLIQRYIEKHLASWHLDSGLRYKSRIKYQI